MLKDLKDKARELAPWNGGKKPVAVRSRRASRPPAAGALWGPFDEMVDSLFGDTPGGGPLGRWLTPLSEAAERFGAAWPRVDVEETDKEFRVTADTPGMDAADMDVSLSERSLTVAGSTRNQRKRRDGNFHVMETYSGSFHRTIPLPGEIDADKVEANFRNGRLTVVLPKSHSDVAGARRIEVKHGRDR